MDAQALMQVGRLNTSLRHIPVPVGIKAAVYLQARYRVGILPTFPCRRIAWQEGLGHNWTTAKGHYTVGSVEMTVWECEWSPGLREMKTGVAQTHSLSIQRLRSRRLTRILHRRSVFPGLPGTGGQITT